MSRENNFLDQPNIEASTSSRNITSRLTNTETNPGFFAYNVPNSFSGTNAASSSRDDPPPYSPTDSNYSLPPPYPADEFPLLVVNASSSQNLPSFLPPNEPIVTKVRPPCMIPTKSSYLPDISNVATAPALDEIDQKTGLTHHEDAEIRRALVAMEASVEWETKEAETKFFAARKKVQRILTAAKTRLKDSEKLEFRRRIENISKLRRISIRKELERQNQMRDDDDRRRIERKNKLVRSTIVLKFLELVFGYITFWVIDSSAPSPNTKYIDVSFFQLTSTSMFITGIFLGCYLIVYVFCDSEPMSVGGFQVDCMLCFIFAIAYFGYSSMEIDHELKIVGYLSAFLYIAELGIKISSWCKKDVTSANATHSIQILSQPRDNQAPIYANMSNLLELLDDDLNN